MFEFLNLYWLLNGSCTLVWNFKSDITLTCVYIIHFHLIDLYMHDNKSSYVWLHSRSHYLPAIINSNRQFEKYFMSKAHVSVIYIRIYECMWMSKVEHA